MKTFILIIAAFIFHESIPAQTTSDILKQQAGQGVKEGATIATEDAANKVTDKVLNSIFNKKKKQDKTPEASVASNNNANNNTTTSTSTGNAVVVNNPPDASLQTYSKYDFIPGDKVLVYEDFAQNAIGDFPANWNTNSGGETVTVSSETGHWLMINKKGIFKPEDIKSLPDNFTLEFDLIYSSNNNIPFLQMLFTSAGNGKDGNEPMNADFNYNKRSGVNWQYNLFPATKEASLPSLLTQPETK